MIYLVGNAPDSSQYERRDFSEFLNWINSQKLYQLDIETNVTPHWCTKKLITLQFGDDSGKVQWVIQWSSLTAWKKAELKQVLENHQQLKVIHNATFEAVVLLFHGIRITNVYDTMIIEMALHCGEILNEDNPEDEANDQFYSLSAVHYRYIGGRLDKSEQTNFGDDILTESKVVYAAKDVQPLSSIRRMQMLELHMKDLEYVASLENEVVLAYAEITFNGMEIDPVKWKENEALAEPVVAKAKQDLDEWLLDPIFYDMAVSLEYISPKDKMTINWNSPIQSRQIIGHFFPFLGDKMTKAALTKLLKDHEKTGSVFSDNRAVPYVEALRDKNWTFIEPELVKTDRQWLIDNNFLLPADTPVINWNSRNQVLALLRVVQKGMPDLSAPTMAKFTHPIGRALEEYKDSLKLMSTYGQAFLDKYVEPDGKVRTSFTQIVSTGRVSSKKPKTCWAA